MLVDLFVDIMVAASLKLLCGMDLFETYLLFECNELICYFPFECTKLIYLVLLKVYYVKVIVS